MKLLYKYRFIFLVSTLSLMSASYGAAPKHTQKDDNTIIVHERTIKKAKIGEPSVPGFPRCGCKDCCRERSNASTLHERDYMIAQALLVTPLPTVLIDIIYDYAGYDLHPRTVSSLYPERVLKGKKDDQTICQLCIITDPAYCRLTRPIVHIVPQEISFDYPIRTTDSTIRSLCGYYCLDFEYQNIIVSSSSLKFSESEGCNKALQEFKKVAEK